MSAFLELSSKREWCTGAAFRESTSLFRRSAVAGIFNSGTNFFTNLFRRNCVMPREHDRPAQRAVISKLSLSLSLDVERERERARARFPFSLVGASGKQVSRDEKKARRAPPERGLSLSLSLSAGRCLARGRLRRACGAKKKIQIFFERVGFDSPGSGARKSGRVR